MTITSAEKTIKEPSKILGSLLSFWNHIAKFRQRQVGLLLVLMLLSALSEVISLGAVLPFIGILTVPEKVLKHPFCFNLAKTLGITAPDQLVLPLAAIFIIAAVVAASIRLLLLWASAQLSNAIGADISVEMFRRTLYQPYTIHVSRNSSQVIDGITHKSWSAMSMLQAVLMIISSTLVLLALMVALLAIDPVVVGVAGLIFGLSYGLISRVARHKLRINSERIATESTKAIKILQEGLGGIRDVLLNGTQPSYCAAYRHADVPYRKAYGSNMFVAVSPRYVMEAVGMILIAGLAFGLSRETGGVASALPVLGALAIGAQRLVPALQQIYSSWASIAGNQASLAEVVQLLNQPLPPEAFESEPEPLEFKHSIRFESVWFRYSQEGAWILADVDLTIPKGSRIGFVGTTGSGKSTTIDLLMGLLRPTEGKILVDGLEITGERLRSWQRALAHVPQAIFLADSTIAENIAFGVPPESIDVERVKLAAEQAHISDFIESQPKGYRTLVGERGVRLSGGQRQRIGIARALYKRASVLVFDEATSSLDNETEQNVMNSIENLHKDLTVLLIAHRLTTVQRCDQIFELSNGRVVAEGSYDLLMQKSPSFKKMAATENFEV